MATRNPRYMVTVNPETSVFLNNISKNTHKPISGIISELINEALELREDYYWSKQAEEAENKSIGKRRIPAEEVWKKCDLT
jgi:predicted DNA-binding protein